MAIQGNQDVFSSNRRLPNGAKPVAGQLQGPAPTAPVAEDASAVQGATQKQLQQSRARMQLAIVRFFKAHSANGQGPALNWATLDYLPRAGSSLVSVSGSDGKEYAFMARQNADGQLSLSLLEAAKDEPAPAPAPRKAPPRQVTIDTTKAGPTGRPEAGPAAEAAAKLQQIQAADKAAESGNVVAKGFNRLLNVFTHNQDQLHAAVNNAVRIYSTELPKDLATYHDMQAAAGNDPAKQEAAKAFLEGALAKAKQAGANYDQVEAKFKGSNKFWSGLTADVGAGIAVLGGAALCLTGFGAPLGAGMIAAGFVAGGAATVGAHALLDNQYDARHEALGNFLVGGLSSAGMVWAGGAGLTAGRMAVTQGVIGGATGSAGAVVQESQDGFKAGWEKRVAFGTLLGAGGGAAAGYMMPGIASRLHLGLGSENALINRGVMAGTSAGVGAVTGGGAALANEAANGFADGWQERVQQQALGATLAGAAYAFAPGLHPTMAKAPVPAEHNLNCMPESVRGVFQKKLQELGFPVSGKANADELLTQLTNDKVFGALLRQTVNNDRYAFKVRNTLAHYGPEALAADMTTPEGRLARLKLLTLSLTPETRAIMMQHIDQHLTEQTAALKAHYQAHPEDAMVDVLAIGTGPNGVALAAEANKAGTHSVLLVGDGFSHFQREGEAFQTNSPNGVHKGHNAAKAGELASPIFGSPVQASDMGSTMYNNAGHVGDAAGIGLLYAAEGAATQVMTNTRVKTATPVYDANGQRQWYEVEMTDGTKVRAKKLVIGAGLGDEPNLPTDPTTRKVDPATAKFASAELARTKAAVESNRTADMAKVKVMTAEQFLTMANQTDDPGVLYRNQDVMIVGPGDGGIVSSGVIFGDAPSAVYGVATAQMGGAGHVTMVGEPDLWSRYGRMGRPVEKGLMSIVKDTYVTAIRPIAGSEKVEVTLQPMKKTEVPNPKAGQPGEPATIKKSEPDGPAVTRITDKVILCTGSKSGEGKLLTSVLPDGYDPERMSLKDPKSPYMETVEGPDPNAEGGPLPVAKRVKGQDIYTIGVSAGLGQRANHSWLQDHGARTQTFTRTVLVADQPAVGLKAKITAPEPAVERHTLDRPGLLRRLVGQNTESLPIVRDESYNPRTKHGDTNFRIKVKLDELFGRKLQFQSDEPLRLTVTERDGQLFLDAPQLDAESARYMQQQITADRDLVHYLHDVTEMGDMHISLGFDEHGHLRSNKIEIGT